MQNTVEANLLALIDSTEDMWGSVDLDYRMVVFNKNFERYVQSCFGVPVTVGMNPMEILPPERAVIWPSFYQRALKEGAFRTEHTLSNGRIYEIAIHAMLSEGKATGLSVYGRDITDRKLAEVRLQDSEERFRSTFEQAAIGIIHTSFDGNFLHCNRRFSEIVGYTNEELKGMPFQQITAPEDQAESAASFARMSKGEAESVCIEKRYLRKDGSRVWVKMSISTQRDGQGNPVHFIAFVEDIDQKKESEASLISVAQALEASEKRYRAAFQTCLDNFGISRVEDGKYVDVNQAFVDSMGFERHEVLGKTSLELGIWVDPADREKLVRTLQRDSYCRNFEARFRTKSGQITWGLMSSSLIVLNGEKCHLTVVRDITERKLSEQRMSEISEALQLTEERYRTAFETSLDAICINRLSDGMFVDVNRAFLDSFGSTREEVIGRTTLELDTWVDPEDRRRMLETLRRDSLCQCMEARFRRRNGEIFWGQFSTSIITIHGENCALNVTRDISEAKAAEERMRAAAEAMRLSEERYHTVFQTSMDGITISRMSDGQYIDVNNAFVDLMGYEREELIGRTSIEVGVWADAGDREKLMEEVRLHSSFRDMQVNYIKKDGKTLYSLTSSSKIEIDGVHCLLSVVRDVSEARAAAEKIEDLACYDPLTRLPNRQMLLDRLRQAISASLFTSGRKCALLVVDVDNLKTLNDTLGHPTGDLRLQEVAMRLKTGVRETDLVARLGGDEFAVLLEDLGENASHAADQSKTVAEKLLAILAKPSLLNGHESLSTCSIGITIFGDCRLEESEVLRQADIAIDQAKAAGRNTLCFYSPELQAAVSARASLEEELRQAIREKQFVLYYQPQVNRGRVVGSEVLVRWRHPQRGILAPYGFIPLAEETGLILDLGSWVLETACEQIMVWSREKATAQLSVAVNISALQFRQPEFVQQVLDVLKRTGADPRNLKLELTESMLVDNIEEVIAKMTSLREREIRFSLDDFGTGYSSLSYLKRLPLDQLKIDRSFVKDLPQDASSGAIAETIISLGRAMKLPVIAEGVETEEQRVFLAHLGCHAFQGYLTSRPLPLDQFQSLLAALNKTVLPYVD